MPMPMPQEDTENTLQANLEATLRQLLPLSPETRISLQEGLLPTGETETILSVQPPERQALHYHLPKALAEIGEEDLIRALVYREGGGCSHAHGED